MQKELKAGKTSGTGKAVFILSAVVSAYFLLGMVTDYYYFKLTGVIYEILWLPMLGMLMFLPVLSLVLFWKDRFRIRSYYLYSFLLLLLSFLSLVLFK